MEWRQQTTVSCADAFNEAQRWIEVCGSLSSLFFKMISFVRAFEDLAIQTTCGDRKYSMSVAAMKEHLYN